MNNKYFGMLSRLKYINRWGLMRNTINENLSEHSLETAFIAHLLAVIRNRRFGGCVNVERCALLAMYHDTTEILTGDLPTPVKYFNPEIKQAYDKVEQTAIDKMLSYIPEDLKEDYIALYEKRDEDTELWSLVKAADKISALIKCIEERQMGNAEFAKAEKSTIESIKKLNIPEADVFLSEFLPGYTLTLDEQA